MPTPSGGIYVELINYKAFSGQVEGLEQQVKELNTQLKVFGESVKEFDKQLGSAFQSLPSIASKAGEAIQKNLIDVIKVVSNSNVKRAIEGFGEAGNEFGVAINSIGSAFSSFKVSTSKLKNFEKVFESLARATSAFNAVRNIGSLTELGAFVDQLPRIFEKLSSLNKYLSVIPSAMFTQLGRVVIGLNNITQPLAKALAAFDQIKVHPGQIIDSLEGLLTIVQRLGKINTGGEDRINFLRAYFVTLLQVAPVLSRLASALQPLSSLNPSTFSGITDFLPGMISFLNDFDNFAKRTSSKSGFIESLKIWAGINTGSLKQMVNTFKALADGLSQFNKVNIISGGKDFGDIALGLQRLVQASVELQDLARLQIFNKKSVIKNVEAAFTALAKGLGAFSSMKIPDAANFKDISRFTKELAKMITSLENLDPHKITRAFESVGRLLSERGERVLEVAFGDSIAEAIASGLRRNMQVFIKLGELMAEGMISGFKGEAEIASPSRVFMRLGTDIVNGLTSGIKGIAKLGSDMATSLYEGFRNAFTGMLGKIKDAVFHQFRDLTYRMGQEFRQFARDLQQTGLQMATTGGIAGFLQSQAVQSAATFEQTMNQIRVFGNLTRDELENVQNAILDFSAVTIFDPQQSAAAFLDLQKAGLSAADALEVLTHVGNLAAAGNIDLTAATKGAIQAIQLFGLEYEDAGRVADTFVQGANASTASVQELIDGLGNVGPLAAEFGLSFEDTIAIMAQFNDAGIRGAEAGTQLRSMLTNITKPTAQVQGLLDKLGVSLVDANGNFRSMSDIIRDLSGAMHDGTRTQQENFQSINKLAGTYGQMGLAVLLAGEDIDSYVAKMNQLPGSAAIAEEMMATFAGRIDSLKGSVQTLIFKALIPLMQKVLAPLFDQLVKFVNLLSSMPEEILAVAAGIVLLGTAMFTLTGVGLFLVGSVLMPIGLALTALSGIITVLGALLFNPIGLIAGFVALGAAVSLLVGLFMTITALIGGVILLVKSFATALKKSSKAATGFEYFKRTVKELFKAFSELGKAVGGLVTGFFNLVFSGGKAEEEADTWGNVFRSLGDAALSLSEKVRGVAKFIEILTTALKGGGKEELAALGQSMRDFVNSNIGKALFGDDQVEATRKLAELLGQISRLARNLADEFHLLVQNFLGLVSGDTSVGDFFKSLADQFGRLFNIFGKPIVDIFVNIGKDIINGLIDGAVGVLDDLILKVIDGFNKFITDIKEFFGIESPSKVMYDIGQDVGTGFSDGVEESPMRKILDFFKGIFEALKPIIREMADSWQNWLIGFAAVQGALFLISKSSIIAGAVSSLISLAGAVVGVVAAFLALRFIVFTVGSFLRSIAEKDFGSLVKQLRRFVSELDIVAEIFRKIGFGGIANAIEEVVDQLNKFLSDEGPLETMLNNLFGFGDTQVGSGNKIVKALTNFFIDIFSTALQVFKDVWLLARGKIVFEDMIANLVSGFSNILGIKFTLEDIQNALNKFVTFVKDNFLVVAGVIGLIINTLFSASIIRAVLLFSVRFSKMVRLFITFRTTAHALLGALRILAIQLVVIPAFLYGLQGAAEGLFDALGGVVSLIKGIANGDFRQIVTGLAAILEGLMAGIVGFIRNIANLLEKGLRLAGLDKFADRIARVREMLEALLDPKVRERIRTILELGLAEGIKRVVTFLGILIDHFNQSPITDIIRSIISAFVDFAGVIYDVGKAVVSVIPEVLSFFGDLFKEFTKFLATDTGKGLVRLLISPLELLASFIKRLVIDGAGFVSFLIKFKEAVAAIGLIALIKAIPTLIAGLSTGAGGGFAVFLTQFATFGILLSGGILAIYGFIGAIKGLVFSLSGLGDLLHGLAQMMSGEEGGFENVIKGLIKIGVGLVAALGGFLLNIGELAAKATEAIGKFLGIELLETIGQRAQAAIAELKKFLTMDILEGVAAGLLDRVKGLAGVFSVFVDAVKENLNLNTLKVIGEYLIQGLWGGIEFVLNTLTGGLWDLFKEKVINPFLEALGIASPSTFFFEIGGNIIQGLIDGIKFAMSLLGTVATELFEFLKEKLNFKNLVSALSFGVNLLGKIKDGFKYAVDFFADIVDIEAIQNLIKGAVTSLFAFLDTLPTPTEVFDAIKGIFDKVVDAIKSVDLSFISEAVQSVKDAFAGLKNFITGEDGGSSDGAGGINTALSTMMTTLNNVTLDSSTRDSVMKLGENLIIAVTSGMGSDASKAAITAVGITMSSLFIKGVQEGFKMTGLVALIGQVWALAILKGFITPGVIMAIGATAREFSQEFLDRVNAMFVISGGISLKGQALGVAFISGIASGFILSAGTLGSAIISIGIMLAQLLVIATPIIIGLGSMIGGLAGAFASAGGVIISTLSGMAAAMNNTWSAANNLATALRNLSGMNFSMPQIPSYAPSYSPPPAPSTSGFFSSVSSGLSSAISSIQSQGKNFNPKYQIPKYKFGGRAPFGSISQTNEGGIHELFRTDTGKTYFMPGQRGTIEPLREVSKAPLTTGGSTTTQNFNFEFNGPMGDWTKESLKSAVREAVEETKNTHTSSMDAKRKLLMTGRR